MTATMPPPVANNDLGDLDEPQLTFEVGGDLPSLSLLKLSGFEHDLGFDEEFLRGNVVELTVRCIIDKIAFDKTLRGVNRRVHSARITSAIVEDVKV